jgi:hypothetical protein
METGQLVRIASLVAVILWFAAPVEGTPQFARQYRVDCSYCHVAPPVLNRRGEDFLARGYRLETAPALMPSHATPPVAVWNTLDVEHRQSGGFTKVFPGRVELISGGTIGRMAAAYFVELRLASLHVAGPDRLLNRSGRFEDAFVTVPLDPRQSVTLMAGQFRSLQQVDVSRRLTISEPLAFSSSLATTRTASTPRLTGLRAFSPSGRQPGVQVMYQHGQARRPADGWFSGLTLPLTGELTMPFADDSSFEFEAHPKGVFAESFYRRGLRSIGGHAFLGDDRRLAQLVLSSDLVDRMHVTAAVGVGHARNVTSARVSLESSYLLSPQLIVGARLDHQSGQRRDPAVLLFTNLHVPFGPVAFRQAARVQFEQRLQPNDYRTLLALSHIF